MVAEQHTVREICTTISSCSRKGFRDAVLITCGQSVLISKVSQLSQEMSAGACTAVAGTAHARQAPSIMTLTPMKIFSPAALKATTLDDGFGASHEWIETLNGALRGSEGTNVVMVGIGPLVSETFQVSAKIKGPLKRSIPASCVMKQAVLNSWTGVLDGSGNSSTSQN